MIFTVLGIPLNNEFGMKSLTMIQNHPTTSSSDGRISVCEPSLLPTLLMFVELQVHLYHTSKGSGSLLLSLFSLASSGLPGLPRGKKVF